MEIEPQRDPRVWEAMEACRPGHDDVSDLGLAFLADHLGSDPALSREFRRLKRLDQTVADAFQDVPVPEGLADRILTCLAADAEARGEQAEATGDTRVRPASESPKFSRRWLFAGAGSIAAAVAVLWLVGIQAGRSSLLEGSNADQTAIEFYQVDTAADGKLAGVTPPPGNYPFAADVQQMPGTRWRWVRNFLGHSAVAYDLTAPTGERGTLYVVLGTATDVADRPSRQPFVTQGCAASVWQADGCLYVLVVEGGERSYGRFLTTPREPLA